MHKTTSSKSADAVLFVNHKNSRCGVYEYGRNVYRCIKESKAFDFIYVEAGSFGELLKSIKKYKPKVIIYNYMLSTMSWSYLKTPVKNVYLNRFYDIPVIQIGMIHSVEQFVADEATGRKRFVTRQDYNKLFDYYIAPDPTLLLKNPLVYKTGRPLMRYENKFPLPTVPTFATAGFAKKSLNYIAFIQKVQNEYDEAVIKINIPKGDFTEECFQQIKRQLMENVTKEGIRLEVTRNFFSTKELLDFLAQSTANFYVYANGARRKREARGISSALDNALSVRRPVIVSNDSMYKHILTELDVDIDRHSIHEIIDGGFVKFETLYRAWQPECMLWEYERIVTDICSHDRPRRRTLKEFLKSKFLRTNHRSDNQWICDTDLRTDNMAVVENHFPLCKDLNENHFNRILNDSARAEYRNVIAYMKELLPNNMRRKIEKANVQQAFVADTVLKLLKNFDHANILCVGCYTDTAYLILKKMGIPVVGIDTVINYDLKTFLSRPDQQGKTYDIIFSTSVIEHVQDDEEFVEEIAGILNEGGYFVMTCDFKEDYRQGDRKPECDFRLYTEYDLKQRLVSHMRGCRLAGDCRWKNQKADFASGDGIKYGFASFVVKKQQNTP